jgi:hypothetical protein
MKCCGTAHSRQSIPGTDSVVRLYQGNGGATVSFWYSVTFRESLLQWERQFFYSYSYPSVRVIECHKDGVELVLDSAGTSRTIPIAEIKGELMKHPLILVDGKEEKPGMNILQLVSIGLSFGLIGVSVLFLSTGLKRVSSA